MVSSVKRLASPVYSHCHQRGSRITSQHTIPFTCRLPEQLLPWRPHGGSPGRTPSILDKSGTNSLVRIELADGRRIQAVLHAGEPELVIRARQGVLEVARDYGRLGTEHILSGLDHLLFVFGRLVESKGHQ